MGQIVPQRDPVRLTSVGLWVAQWRELLPLSTLLRTGGPGPSRSRRWGGGGKCLLRSVLHVVRWPDSASVGTSQAATLAVPWTMMQDVKPPCPTSVPPGPCAAPRSQLQSLVLAGLQLLCPQYPALGSLCFQCFFLSVCNPASFACSFPVLPERQLFATGSDDATCRLLDLRARFGGAHDLLPHNTPFRWDHSESPSPKEGALSR